MQADLPLVSMIMRTYNRARLLPRAIGSVLAQTYPHIELVVVNDASTDDTASVLAEYAGNPTIRVITHAVNQGATAAFNTGLDNVRGEYTTGLDSDDELLPEAVETLVRLIGQLGPDYGMVFANCQDPGTGKLTGFGLSQDGEVTYRDVVCGRISGEFWGLWRTAWLGSLRFDPEALGGEYLVWHKLYRGAKVHYLHKALRNYYLDTPDSISRPVFKREKLLQRARTYRLYVEEFGADIARWCPPHLAKLLQIQAFWLMLAGERLAAIGPLATAFRAAPSAKAAALVAAVGAPRFLLEWYAAKRLSR